MGRSISKRRIAATVLGSRLVERVWSPGEAASPELRILAYHRVLDDDPRAFDFDYDLVSASTEGFRRQLQFVRRNFDVISFEDLAKCEDEGRPWPQRALIITFDDGYRDNYTHAYPLLKEMNLPATIYLTTGHVGHSKLFWWDLLAYCIKHTPRNLVKLPEVSEETISLATPHSRQDATQRILRWLKRVPEESKQALMQRLGGELGVDVPTDAAAGMHLTWDEVREMAAHGIRFGSHTVTHPILANVTEQQLADEVVQSRNAIRRELGVEPVSFSYPVGGMLNFNTAVQEAVARAGFRFAVSYEEGLASRESSDRYALPRVHVETHDLLMDFKAKLMFPALMLSRA